MSSNRTNREGKNAYTIGLAFLHREDKARQALARELHDKTGQQLALLGYELDRMASAAKAGEPVHAQGLQMLQAHLDELADALRSIERRLHPSTLTDLGLAAALRSLVKRWNENNASPRLNLVVANELPPLRTNTALACYRMLEEVLMGPIRLAEYKELGLTITSASGHLVFTLESLDGDCSNPTCEISEESLLSLQTRAYGLDAELHLGLKNDCEPLFLLRVPLGPTSQ